MINIVLFEPEIPQNAGNIMRTCVGIGAKLHLIKPLGFSLDESKIKRYSVNHLDKLNYQVYENYDEFMRENKGVFLFLTRYATKSYDDFTFEENENYYLIFGKESTGIPKEILNENIETCFRIPTTEDIRSLNLSNAVAIVAYEALRQLKFSNLKKFDVHKGFDYLNRV